MAEEDPDLQFSWFRQCVANSTKALERGIGLAELVAVLRDTVPPTSDDKINEPPESWLFWTYCCRANYEIWGGKDADLFVLAELWRGDVISEGQGAKVLGIGRVDFREICDTKDMAAIYMSQPVAVEGPEISAQQGSG